MKDIDNQALTKALMLKLCDVYEWFFTLRLAVQAKGLVTTSEMEAAAVQIKPVFEKARSDIEKLGTEESPTLEQLLRDFEGPLQ